MKLFVIRHGETNANAKKLIQSDLMDESLNALGRQQIFDCLARLQDFAPVAIYHSGFKRTRESAEIIGKHFGLVPLELTASHEIKFGSLAGLPFAEAAEKAGAVNAEFFLDTLLQVAYDFTSFGGESAAQVDRRIREQVFGWLHERHAGEQVILVSHGAIIRMMHKIFGNELVPWYENGSIHQFAVTEQHVRV